MQLLLNTSRYEDIANQSIENDGISENDIKWIIEDENVELLPLLHCAYKVKYKYFQNKIRIHILNNVQSGNCTEDCKYCAQSHTNDLAEKYPMKTDEEILKEAEAAYNAGAYRHCMVFSGRDIGNNRIAKISTVVKKIKEKYKDMEICVSAGFLNEEDAVKLVGAGVNRYNHNINTSRNHYGKICTTHDYEKRVETINIANKSGLEICSGIIIGLGESPDDIVQIIGTLKKVKADSIPINFFIPIPGHNIEKIQSLTPVYCLKILACFRLAFPRSEIRIAAGREYHLRSMQALSLYAVNSLFAKGYLTTDGDDVEKTKKKIIDAGFVLDKIEY